MGRQIIWDGAGLPEVGDEVLFETASDRDLQRGKIVRFEVSRSRYDKDRMNGWRIMVYMACNWAGIEPYPMGRLLEEVYPLTFKKEAKTCDTVSSKRKS